MEVQVSGESHHPGKQGTDCPVGRVSDKIGCSELQSSMNLSSNVLSGAMLHI